MYNNNKKSDLVLEINKNYDLVEFISNSSFSDLENISIYLDNFLTYPLLNLINNICGYEFSNDFSFNKQSILSHQNLIKKYLIHYHEKCKCSNILFYDLLFACKKYYYD